MKGIIIGFGTIAQGHMRGYERSRNLSIAAVVDHCAARRRFAQEKFGLPAYANLDELLDAEQIEFIDVCTPPSSHSSYILAGIDRRLPVLCEKPVFVPGEIPHHEIISRIIDSGVLVYPSSNYKFAPVFSRVRGILTSGALGDTMSVRIRILRNGHARGVPEWYPHWRRNPKLSAGGILRDHGPHAVYLATSLTGLVPVSVSCIAGRMTSDEWDDSEDTALLRVSCADGEEIEISLSWAATYRDSYYFIAGSRNSVTVSNDEVTFTNDGKAEKTTIHSNFDDPSHSEWFAAMLDDFYEMANEADQPPARMHGLLEESMLTTAVIDSGYASASLGGVWLPVKSAAAERAGFVQSASEGPHD